MQSLKSKTYKCSIQQRQQILSPKTMGFVMDTQQTSQIVHMYSSPPFYSIQGYTHFYLNMSFFTISTSVILGLLLPRFVPPPESNHSFSQVHFISF